jgi:hypothetical protein
MEVIKMKYPYPNNYYVTAKMAMPNLKLNEKEVAFLKQGELHFNDVSIYSANKKKIVDLQIKGSAIKFILSSQNPIPESQISRALRTLINFLIDTDKPHNFKRYIYNRRLMRFTAIQIEIDEEKMGSETAFEGALQQLEEHGIVFSEICDYDDSAKLNLILAILLGKVPEYLKINHFGE